MLLHLTLQEFPPTSSTQGANGAVTAAQFEAAFNSELAAAGVALEEVTSGANDGLFRLVSIETGASTAVNITDDAEATAGATGAGQTGQAATDHDLELLGDFSCK